MKRAGRVSAGGRPRPQVVDYDALPWVTRLSRHPECGPVLFGIEDLIVYTSPVGKTK